MDTQYQIKRLRIEKNYWWHTGRRDCIVRLLSHIPRSSTVLDVGTGGGYLLSDLQAMGFRSLFGIDFDPLCVEHARQQGLSQVMLGDARGTKYTDGKFDVVIASDILEHIENESDALTEWNRILKPGGTLIVFVPGHLYLWGENDMLAHHVRRYKNRAHLSRVLQKNGFHVERCSWWNIFLFLPIATIILLIKLKDRIFHRGKHEPGDHIYELPRLLNRFLKRVLVLENKILAKGFDSPVGVSLFAVARKKP